MKKGVALAALCMAGALVFSAPAQAYDYFFSYDTAAVKAAGGLSGSAGVAYITAGKGWDADGDNRARRVLRELVQDLEILLGLLGREIAHPPQSSSHARPG
jgi:hypothetical protein